MVPQVFSRGAHRLWFSRTRLIMTPRLTFFGRSLLLLTCEVLANAVCWIVAGILSGKSAAI